MELVAQFRRGRSWWIEYVELIEEGFIRCAGTEAERRQARAMRCSCGWEMSVRVELIGDEGELVARRAYALIGDRLPRPDLDLVQV